MSAVEADADRVGTMVVYGTPFNGVVSDVSVRLRSVMLIEGENVMKAEGHHIVNAGLTRTEHHAEKW